MSEYQADAHPTELPGLAEIPVLDINNIDLDETPCSVASDLGRHLRCLPRPLPKLTVKILKIQTRQICFNDPKI